RALVRADSARVSLRFQAASASLATQHGGKVSATRSARARGRRQASGIDSEARDGVGAPVPGGVGPCNRERKAWRLVTSAFTFVPSGEACPGGAGSPFGSSGRLQARRGTA